jgi:hypothetical protein
MDRFTWIVGAILIALSIAGIIAAAMGYRYPIFWGH